MSAVFTQNPGGSHVAVSVAPLYTAYRPIYPTLVDNRPNKDSPTAARPNHFPRANDLVTKRLGSTELEQSLARLRKLLETMGDKGGAPCIQIRHTQRIHKKTSAANH
ncbi:hypothetical protein ACJJTC_007388 [Scirpophaga incertulas]